MSIKELQQIADSNARITGTTWIVVKGQHTTTVQEREDPRRTGDTVLYTARPMPTARAGGLS